MLNELAPNIFWMAADETTDRPIVAAIAGDSATLMVEAGNSDKHARLFLDALAAKPLPPLRYVVLPHAHWDHVFGAAAIKAVTISSRATRDIVATMATYKWSDEALDARVAAGLEIPFCREMIKAELSPTERRRLKLKVPELAFEREMVIDLGNRPVHLIYVGGDHAADSSIVVVPGIVAFLSDCVYRNLHTEPNYLTQRHFLPLLDRLLALDVEAYVLGHDDGPMSRKEFELFATTAKRAAALVAQDGMDQAALDAEIENNDEVARFVTLFQAGLSHEDV